LNSIVLIESERIKENIFKLENRKFIHLKTILKIQKNSQLKCCLLNSSVGKFLILEIGNESILGEYFPEETNLSSVLENVRIFIAYQRPQTTKKILQLISNLGVQKIFFFRSEKSEKSYADSKIFENENLLSEIVLGLEQGKRFEVPDVEHLSAIYSIKEKLNKNKRFVLDLNQKPFQYFENAILDNQIDLALGPESGFIEKEISYLESLGFQSISVSQNNLRTEIACTFILSQLEFVLSKITRT
jgi:16S rRNA (uracil1498-N3)-methyltransferase